MRSTTPRLARSNKLATRDPSFCLENAWFMRVLRWATVLSNDHRAKHPTPSVNHFAFQQQIFARTLWLVARPLHGF
jgi:hypothetical protein